jgi:hypothetical protein
LFQKFRFYDDSKLILLVSLFNRQILDKKSKMSEENEEKFFSEFEIYFQKLKDKTEVWLEDIILYEKTDDIITLENVILIY